MDKATEDANNGMAEIGVEYKLKDATVTIPFNTDNLNFVKSKYCLIDLAKVVYINLLI